MRGREKGREERVMGKVVREGNRMEIGLTRHSHLEGVIIFVVCVCVCVCVCLHWVNKYYTYMSKQGNKQINKSLAYCFITN